MEGNVCVKSSFACGILKIERGSVVGYVKWLQEHCCFVVYSTGDSPRYYMIEGDKQLDYVEVIGNAYKNADLLEG